MAENYGNELQYAVGVGSGYGVYRSAKQILKKPVGRFMKSQLCNTPKDLNDTFWSAANKAYENSNLKDVISCEIKKNKKSIKTIFGEIKIPEIKTRKRAEIIDINPSNAEKITNDVITKLGFDKNPILNNRLYKIIFGDKKAELAEHIKQIANGENACHVRPTGQVLVNKEKMAFSTFHELGHAMNATGTGFGKFLSKSRGLFALGAPLVLGIGLLRNKPKETTEQKSFKNKTYDFIKENCGILAGLCFVPTILEEGMASINGAKLAKPYLDKNVFKKLNVMNAKAWSSYVLGAIIAGVSVKAGVIIRDLIVHDKTPRIITE